LHLSQYEDPANLLKFAKSSGTLLLLLSTNRSDSMITLRFADENAGWVVPFVGVHPSEALVETSLDWVETATRGAEGVGEIGLDPRYSEAKAGSPQMENFQRQLSIAERQSKPVQVHSRGAEKECLGQLGSYSPNGVLLHWFEGESEVKEAADRGYFVSFGPALLYSRKLQRMASEYPADLILSESDGPVTFSALGGASGAWLIPSVVFKLAELKRDSFESLSEGVARNCAAYLGKGGKG
jgi:TatD DNase family protein